MKRLLTLICALVLAIGAPAAAQTDVESQLRTQGYYIEPGISPDANSISRSVSAMRGVGSEFFSLSLASDEFDAQDVADEVVTFFGTGTAIVLAPSSIGASSTEFSSSQLNQALDSIPNSASDAIAVAAFARSLAPEAFSTTSTAPSSSSGGGGIPWTFITLVGVGVFGTWLLVRGNSKREEKAQEEDLDEARTEIQAQIDAIANEILEDNERVALSEDDEVRSYFEQASNTYAEATDELERATTLSELEKIADRLDEARWQLAAGEALMDGEPIPPKPKRERATCFFDPTHRPATQKATLRTRAGDKEVMVCDDDAERLRKGEEPRPRMINVGGRPTPAPMAPRSYGGGGFGGLDVFTILLGGLARSGGFGDFLGGRPRSSRNRRGTWGRSSPWNTVTPRSSRPTVTRTPRTRSSAGRSRSPRSRSSVSRSRSRSRSSSSRSRGHTRR